eukprot:10868103-Alexandrium_andersonii.AAC.1
MLLIASIGGLRQMCEARAGRVVINGVQAAFGFLRWLWIVDFVRIAVGHLAGYGAHVYESCSGVGAAPLAALYVESESASAAPQNGPIEHVGETTTVADSLLHAASPCVKVRSNVA